MATQRIYLDFLKIIDISQFVNGFVKTPGVTECTPCCSDPCCGYPDVSMVCLESINRDTLQRIKTIIPDCPAYCEKRCGGKE